MVSSGNMGDSSSNLGHLEELFLGVNADRLGCSGCRNVSSSHLAIHQEALAQALLCKRNDLKGKLAKHNSVDSCVSSEYQGGKIARNTSLELHPRSISCVSIPKPIIG